MITKLLEKFSLPLYKTNSINIFFSTYKYGPFKVYSKDIYFILDTNNILFNIRNTKVDIFYIIPDKKANLIKQELINLINNSINATNKIKNN
ncbi:hypothetical protein ACQ33O_00850 [Ferruginibacter sp. SUN002]|uniref:hypothetical protein n=1 Tax=Ferruginibacter sp. SUN002 TaxID=2937789 RepID=UPI003D35E83F